MNYYSTSTSSHKYSLNEAIDTALAPDGGLYMPESIPEFSDVEIREMSRYEFHELAATVLHPFFAGQFDFKTFNDICREAFTFDVPLRMLPDGNALLELFHGPTLAFKDFGARFLARVMSRLNQGGGEITVLAATSGDTGGAVAGGFFRVPGINVVVLYPKDKVSRFQESQFAALGENIRCLRIDGTFDDCQALVKKAFRDGPLRQSVRLTSANSINIGRWIPQSAYYFYGFLRWQEHREGEIPAFAVPSGNYGNLAAGILARRMGLPVINFIAASNMNNTVPEYLRTGIYEPRKSIETVANAMDVGNPSNFARMMALTGDSMPLESFTEGYEFSDEAILGEISSIYNNMGYLTDPHTATGLLALKKSGRKGIVLGTAHPCKFRDVLPGKLGDIAQVPDYFLKPEGDIEAIDMDNDYTLFKKFLITNLP